MIYKPAKSRVQPTFRGEGDLPKMCSFKAKMTEWFGG